MSKLLAKDIAVAAKKYDMTIAQISEAIGMTPVNYYHWKKGKAASPKMEQKVRDYLTALGEETYYDKLEDADEATIDLLREVLDSDLEAEDKLEILRRLL